MTARSYHLLLVRDDDSAPWCIDFGDYSKAVVKAEQDDVCDHDHRRSNTRVLTVNADDQPSLDRAVADLNASA